MAGISQAQDGKLMTYYINSHNTRIAWLVLNTVTLEGEEHEQGQVHRQQHVDPSVSGSQSTSTRLPLWGLTSPLYTER